MSTNFYSSERTRTAIFCLWRKSSRHYICVSSAYGNAPHLLYRSLNRKKLSLPFPIFANQKHSRATSPSRNRLSAAHIPTKLWQTCRSIYIAGLRQAIGDQTSSSYRNYFDIWPQTRLPLGYHYNCKEWWRPYLTFCPSSFRSNVSCCRKRKRSNESKSTWVTPSIARTRKSQPLLYFAWKNPK